MNIERKYGKFKRFINGLVKRGRYTFSRADLQKELGLAADSLSVLISRSKKEGVIASPVKGFFVYVPPEYSSLGCLPAADFIPQLMKYWKEDYYVCLLSAAAIYGAAHHQPQAYQVMSIKAHRPIKVGNVRIVFYKSKDVGALPTLTKNTSTGTIKVSSPEVTAFDLVTKISEAGGLGNLSTVLTELSERLSKRSLVSVAKQLDRTQSIQKLGFILDELGCSHLTESIHKLIMHKMTKFIPLIPGKSFLECERNLKWKIIANELVEAEV